MSDPLQGENTGELRGIFLFERPTLDEHAEFRHGNRNARNIYRGADQHVAVVVDPNGTVWAEYLIDALNAYWALGNRPEDEAVR